MSKIFTPTNQIRLTNVAVVRMKKGGIRFEIACYKNKVLSWRNKIETDVNEVLHTHTVFTNVSKGQVAKKEDLIKVFGTDDQTEVCKIILTSGELQISERERATNLDSLFKEVAHHISEKCINPATKRPYPITFIEKAMKDSHISLKPNKNAKQLALDVIPKLNASSIPIERARMRIKVSTNSRDANKMKASLSKIAINVEVDKWNDGEFLMVFLIDPGCYRQVEEITNSVKGGAIMELVDLKEIQASDEQW